MVSLDDEMTSELNKANKLWKKGQVQLDDNKQQAEVTMRESLQHLRNAFHIASEEPKIGNILR